LGYWLLQPVVVVEAAVASTPHHRQVVAVVVVVGVAVRHLPAPLACQVKATLAATDRRVQTVNRTVVVVVGSHRQEPMQIALPAAVMAVVVLMLLPSAKPVLLAVAVVV
jgi:hypothetical protein